MEKKSKLSILTNGIIRENPTLVLLLGTCPFLATSSSLINALGMGLSATAVLICSNIVISMLRKVIPDKVRIPCYIVVIAGFVTLVQFVLQAYAPDINKDGEITGVKVTEHADTPGVGTKAHAAEHLSQYEGLTELGSDVVKSDPSVQHVTGASVSSGAVHKAVYCALEQYKAMGGVK